MLLVEKYNPNWPEWFETILVHLGKETTEPCLRVDHIGSTSVPGMTAKPVIDLNLVIRDQDFELASGMLIKRGYFHQGDLGIQGREAFGWVNGSPPSGIPYHHLYVCLENSTEWRRQLGFRDFLREHPEYVAAEQSEMGSRPGIRQ